MAVFATNEMACPFQDGSFLLKTDPSSVLLQFPYLPFLEMDPAWNPALPTPYGQPRQPVRPLHGLAGVVELGLKVEEKTLFELDPGGLVWESTNVYSGKAGFTHDGKRFDLSWFVPRGLKGVCFDLDSHECRDTSLVLRISGPNCHQQWATPGKKKHHDWGYPQYHWDDTGHTLLQTYSNPVDATHSPVSVLWVSPDNAVNFISPDKLPEGTTIHQTLEVSFTDSGKIQFGFIHADNDMKLNQQISLVCRQTIQSTRSDWDEWCDRQMEQLAISTKNPSMSNQTINHVKNVLIKIRQHWLSNGIILSHPLDSQEYRPSLHETVMASHLWRALSLENPFKSRLESLLRYNRLTERSIPIISLSGDNWPGTLQASDLLVVTPDPENPPTEELFSALLGMVIAGGKVTLVDGVHGFENQDGWWKKKGYTDPCDYALRTLGVRVDPNTRRVLDHAGISESTNTFSLGWTELHPFPMEDQLSNKVIPPQKGGYLLIHGCGEPGAILHSLEINGELIRPFTSAEENILVSMFDSRVHVDTQGLCDGRELVHEGYVAYRLPQDVTPSIHLTIKGDWKAWWNPDPPAPEITLQRKAFISGWYTDVLKTVTLPRIAHPIIHEGTYTARVFDITGTEWSPVLFQNIGRGSFAYVGLPKEFLASGSDTGTDAQHSLRLDQTYDLLRFVLALHDPRSAGGNLASRNPWSGWNDQINQGPNRSVPPESLFDAWMAISMEPNSLRSGLFREWALSQFMDSLDMPKFQGNLWKEQNLVITQQSGTEVLDLTLNYQRYLVVRELESVFRKGHETWRTNTTRNWGNEIKEGLNHILEMAEQPESARDVIPPSTHTLPYDLKVEQDLLMDTLVLTSRKILDQDLQSRMVHLALKNQPEEADLPTICSLAMLESASQSFWLTRLVNISQEEFFKTLSNDTPSTGLKGLKAWLLAQKMGIKPDGSHP